MHKELEFWRFIENRLAKRQSVMLLVVAESSGSSPGRAGYKMAVAENGELAGSIGGGVMEVNLVEQSRAFLSEPGAVATGLLPQYLVEQIHQKNSPHSSGMICSGRQTVIFNLLTPENSGTVENVIHALESGKIAHFRLSQDSIALGPASDSANQSKIIFEKTGEAEFTYIEKLGYKNKLYIVGGGHCALALSEIVSKLDFRISIFDDRPDLNTIEKNQFAHEITIIESYDHIGEFIPAGRHNYVVVMTLGYSSDEIVIRNLLDKDFKYFGVLGSQAKMAVLLKTLEKDGLPADRIAKIRTPVGLPINSHTPEEIAVSIAAEIIAVKNAREQIPPTGV